MRKFFAILFLFLCCLSAEASTFITASVTFTNQTTNGMTITANSDTRTWTNAVFIPSTQIPTNNTAAGSALNFLVHIGSYPLTGVGSFAMVSVTNVYLTSVANGNLTVTVSAGYATVSYVTNSLGTNIPVIVPLSGYNLPQQTNVSSGVTAMINDSSNTNWVHIAAGASNLLALANSAFLPTNALNIDGIVLRGSGNPNKVWGTDSSGNPSWITVAQAFASTNFVTHQSLLVTNELNGSWAYIGTNGEFFATNAASGGWIGITNGALTLSNAATGFSLTLTNGGGTFGSNVVAQNFYGALNGNASTSTWSTNFISVASLDIPMGAWFTNNCGNGADVTAANATSATNAGDGFIFATGSTTNQARTRIALPYGWNAGTIQVGTFWLCTGTNNAAAAKTNFVVQYKAAAVGPADRLDSLTFGSALFMTNNCNPFPYEQGTKAVSNPITVGNSPAANKGIVLDIEVCGNAAGTTETNSSLILADVQVYYQTTNQISFPSSSP